MGCYRRWIVSLFEISFVLKFVFFLHFFFTCFLGYYEGSLVDCRPGYDEGLYLVLCMNVCMYLSYSGGKPTL